MNVDVISTSVGFFLFIPLLFIAGVYGIFNYGKIKKERKLRKENIKSNEI